MSFVNAGIHLPESIVALTLGGACLTEGISPSSAVPRRMMVLPHRPQKQMWPMSECGERWTSNNPWAVWLYEDGLGIPLRDHPLQGATQEEDRIEQKVRESGSCSKVMEREGCSVLPSCPT